MIELGLPRRRIILLAVLFLFFALVLFPLAAALPMLGAGKMGLGGRDATGSIWSGRLSDASLAGFPLGDVKVGLRPLPLFIGSGQVDFTAPALRGVLMVSLSTAGIGGANGSVEVGGQLGPLPLARLELDDVTVIYRGTKCTRANGRVRASFAGDVGGLSLPGGMSGVARCDGDDLLLPLVSQSGMENLALRVDGDGKWRARLGIRSNDPALSAKLVAAGFTPGPGGFELGLSGRL